jgi:PEP-CTERM motif
MNRIRASYLIIALLLLLVASGAAQDIGIVLSQTTLSGVAGTTLTFDATLTNFSSNTIFLNGDSYTTASAFLTVSDNPFLNNAPLSLGAGAGSGPFAIFTVTIGPGEPAGIYTLNGFTILGGLTNIDFIPVGSASFTVEVSPVPEPGTLVLVTSGLLGLGIKRRFGKRS